MQSSANGPDLKVIMLGLGEDFAVHWRNCKTPQHKKRTTLMVQTVGTVLYQTVVFLSYKIYYSFVQAAKEQRQVGRHTPTPQGAGPQLLWVPKGGQRLMQGWHEIRVCTPLYSES